MIDFAETHVEFILELRPVLFPLDGFNDPFGRGIRPNAFVALTPCKSVSSTRLRYSLRYINCEDTVSLSIRFPMLRPDPLFSAISATYCSEGNSWNCY